jgi:TRAP-type uncharacterized transport system fused permease subunit
MAVGVQAVKLGWIAFLMPFLFVYRPALLMQGSPEAVLGAAASVLVAMPLIGAGLMGHALGPLGPAARAGALALGVLAVFPPDRLPGGAAAEGAGVLAGAAVLAAAWWRARERRPGRR